MTTKGALLKEKSLNFVKFLETSLPPDVSQSNAMYLKQIKANARQPELIFTYIEQNIRPYNGDFEKYYSFILKDWGLTLDDLDQQFKAKFKRYFEFFNRITECDE